MAAGDSLETFLLYVNKTPTCWLWTGAITHHGHGRVTWNRQTKLAHRVSWILHNGLILPGLVVCHTCPNKLCVRPSHLYLGTVADNASDGNRVPYGKATVPYLSRKHDVAQWFWNILGNPTDATICWLWPKATNKWGYGLFRLSLPDGTKETLAHRAAWILTHGPIPPDMRVCHNCPQGDNPTCCNPHHMWLGSQADNIRDRNAKGRMPYGTRTNDKNGRWALKYDACIECGTTEHPHKQHGRCSLCHWRWYNPQRREAQARWYRSKKGNI